MFGRELYAIYSLLMDRLEHLSLLRQKVFPLIGKVKTHWEINEKKIKNFNCEYLIPVEQNFNYFFVR